MTCLKSREIKILKKSYKSLFNLDKMTAELVQKKGFVLK